MIAKHVYTYDVIEERGKENVCIAYSIKGKLHVEDYF